MLTMHSLAQNKRGKYDRNDDRDEKEKAPEEPVEDPLKDATTLYVGNLYDPRAISLIQNAVEAHIFSQIILHYRGTDP
jgi:hypothetical protein